MFLNIYRDSVVIHDRLCVGDSVVVKEGPVESRRGIVTQIRPDGLVTFERDYGHVSSNVATFVPDSPYITNLFAGCMPGAYINTRKNRQSHLQSSCLAQSSRQTSGSHNWSRQRSYRICLRSQLHPKYFLGPPGEHPAKKFCVD